MKHRLSNTVVTLLLLLSFCAIARSQDPFTLVRERILAKDGVSEPRPLDLFPVERGMGKIFEQSVSRAGATAFRIHFQVADPSPRLPSWGVRILDGSRRVVWSYTAVSGETEFWSAEVPGDRAVVEVYSVEENSPLKLKIDRLLVRIPPVKPQAITIPDNRAPILSQSVQIKNWGRSVAKLRFISDSNGVGYDCTGFLVSADLFMTNNHCISTANEARSALVEFDYDSSAATPVTLRFKELLLADRALDFALLRLANNPGRSPLPLAASGVAEGGSLLIIQHPGGEPKQVSIIDCRVQGVQIDGVSGSLTDFGHLCDTLGGSSGSPIQDFATGRVIGLHHLGFRANSARLVNQGVQIGLILDYIRQKRPDIMTELGAQ